MWGMVAFRNTSGKGFDWHCVDATEWCKRYQGQLRAAPAPQRKVSDLGPGKQVSLEKMAQRKLRARKVRFMKLAGSRRPVGIFIRA